MEKKLILVVDDVQEFVDCLRDSILNLGYDVASVPDGKSAVLFLESSRLPDCIITDLMLRGMPGTDLINQIKRKQCWKSIPCILMSGFETNSNRHSGADFFALKPEIMWELPNILLTALSDDV